MNYSSYTQIPQPDPNQYQQQYPESYDPQFYYPYNPQQHQQYDSQYHQYYTQDCANSSYNIQYDQVPASIHPPGVPIPSSSADSATTHLQNAYYGHENQQQQPSSDGLNPAAVSGLNQFPGTVGIGQTPYRGGGRRGNRPFRGGRGHLGYHGHKPNGPAPPFRGRGRGQGGSRHFQLYDAASSNPNTASVPAEGVVASMQPPSALPAQVSPASFWQPPRMAWCELCRVDCNTPEILEQHKNGKRHKKALLKHEELQKSNKVNTEQQNTQMPNTEVKPEVGYPEKVGGFEEKQPLQEKLTSEVVTDDNRNDTDHTEKVGKAEASAEPENKSRGHFAERGRGSKRKMRGGRGGKCMRTKEGLRRPVEPPRPKQVVHLICQLCNVRCESQVVFDSHLSGKKHMATLKRFESHRALYGEQGLQALYPSNLTIASTSVASHVQQPVIDPQAFLSQVQHGGNDPQVLLANWLMSYVLSQTQSQGVAAPPEPMSAVVPTPGTSFGTQNHLIPQIQGLVAVCQDASQNAVTVDGKSQLESVSVNSEAPAAVNRDTNSINGTSKIEVKEESIPFADSVLVPMENPGPSEDVSEKASDKEGEVAASSPEKQDADAKVQETLN